MFPQQAQLQQLYSDGQHLYQHLDLVIYLSNKPCFVCQDNLDGVVDDFYQISSGKKVSFCSGCKQKLQQVA